MDDHISMGLCCSFCGKSQREVKQIIAGPTVFICNECVDLCSDIIDQTEKPREEEKEDLILALRLKTDSFTDLFNSFCKLLDLDDEKISDILGPPIPTVSRWRSGEVIPPGATLIIATMLNILAVHQFKPALNPEFVTELDKLNDEVKGHLDRLSRTVTMLAKFQGAVAQRRPWR